MSRNVASPKSRLSHVTSLLPCYVTSPRHVPSVTASPRHVKFLKPHYVPHVTSRHIPSLSLRSRPWRHISHVTSHLSRPHVTSLPTSRHVPPPRHFTSPHHVPMSPSPHVTSLPMSRTVHYVTSSSTSHLVPRHVKSPKTIPPFLASL